jgi:hypothetical protein
MPAYEVAVATVHMVVHGQPLQIIYEGRTMSALIKRLDAVLNRGEESPGRGGNCVICGKGFSDCPHSYKECCDMLAARKMQRLMGKLK